MGPAGRNRYVSHATTYLTHIVTKGSVVAPMDVTFLYTGNCGHCRKALETVERILEAEGSSLREDAQGLHFEAVDVEEHPEAAEAHHLSSCPGIVVDGTLEFVGVPSPETLRSALGSSVRGAEPTFVRGYETPH